MPVMSFSEIEQEFDKIAITHPPPESETPFDWRVIGITGKMTIQFCKTKPDLQLIIFHKGNKIYSLPSSERNKGQVSTLVLEPFGDHAMFRSDNKFGASKSNTKITNDEEDDDDQLPVTIPTISKAKPPNYSD